MNYDIGSSLFYGMDNEETCQSPSCRYEHAKLADGVFDLAKETVQILQAEPLTHAMLAAISEASKAYLNGTADAETTLRRITKISGKLGSMFAKSLNYGAAATTLFMFWFTIFPSHLEAIQGLIGEKELPHKNFQIEKVCLEAFGEAATCQYIVSEDKATDQRGSGQQKQQAIPSNFASKAASEPLASYKNIVVPLHGPIPSQKPVSMNRHERRKAEKLTRATKPLK